ncbi:sensor histidine kinase [Bifidobacterium leontopitheci]|uniref:Histidine kinase n=1 Tax=Bifidobacterium leontopitheci TaxID=2650774 RepID=A0A6I1GID1_9BIFI|nr:hypothetical protein [Bifidobacterium leontopitheci]KAB7791430.1 hypothetical protein F7D09_0105 [Bifidobacterium leontopitheci]
MKTLANTTGIEKTSQALFRIGVALTVLMLLLSILDWVSDPAADVYSIVVGIVDLILIALIPVFPETCGILILVLEMVCSIYGTVGGPSRIWGDALATGAIVLCDGHVATLIAIIAGQGTILLIQTEYSHDGADRLALMSDVFVLTLIALGGLLGMMINVILKRQRLREEEHERKLEQERQRNRMRMLEYAAQVHDHVSGRLANIAMICSRHAGPLALDGDVPDDARSADDDEDWRLVASQAAESLADVHAIIELMSGIRDRQAEERANEPYLDRLRRLCGEISGKLDHDGLHGSFAVRDNGIAAKLDGGRLTLLGELLDEVGSNIARHCPVDGTYACSVMLHDGVAEVTQYNDVSAQPCGITMSTHKGLELYRERVTGIGGAFRTGTKDGMWTLYACVPLT